MHSVFVPWFVFRCSNGSMVSRRKLILHEIVSLRVESDTILQVGSVRQGNVFRFTLRCNWCTVNAHVVSHLLCGGAVCSLNWLMDYIKWKDLRAETLLWWGFLMLCRLCQSGLKGFNETAAAAAAEYVIAGYGSGGWASRLGLIQRHWKHILVEAKSS